ncbi:MAG: hypothetical protein H0X37_26430 [Herpetosiphonaceae bacterium]|nr:hypothetical protein [Herpetosiphonaceae bacterium]
MAKPAANWFGHCRTVAEAKAEYRRLCFMYHPDHGGDSALMQHINQAYRLALRSGLAAEAPQSKAVQSPRRRSSPPQPHPTNPQREWSRDALRQVWNASPWQQVAGNQFQRTIGSHVVTIVHWTANHETMWAVQAAGQFSKFAFLNRAEAEEEGFNLLYRQFQAQSS